MLSEILRSRAVRTARAIPIQVDAPGAIVGPYAFPISRDKIPELLRGYFGRLVEHDREGILDLGLISTAHFHVHLSIMPLRPCRIPRSS